MPGKHSKMARPWTSEEWGNKCLGYWIYFLHKKTLYISPSILDSPISTNCGTEGFFITSVGGQVHFYSAPAFWENWCISHFCKLFCEFNWHLWRCRWENWDQIVSQSHKYYKFILVFIFELFMFSVDKLNIAWGGDQRSSMFYWFYTDFSCRRKKGCIERFFTYSNAYFPACWEVHKWESSENNRVWERTEWKFHLIRMCYDNFISWSN